MFTTVQPATTPFTEGAELKPVVRIINDATIRETEGKTLPRSSGQWNPYPSDVAYLSNIFGADLLDKMPIIAITSGSTDYLDLVSPRDFEDGVFFVKGVDPFKRPFVSFALQVDKANPDKTFRYIYTVFRRYSNPSSIWMLCRSHWSESDGFLGDHLLKCSTSIYDETVEILKKMVQEFQSGNQGTLMNYKACDEKTPSEYRMKFYCPHISN